MTAQLTLEALSELMIFPGLTCKLFACFGLRAPSTYDEVEVDDFILRDGWTPELIKTIEVSATATCNKTITQYAHSDVHRDNDKPARSTSRIYAIGGERSAQTHFFEGNCHRDPLKGYARSSIRKFNGGGLAFKDTHYCHNKKHRAVLEGPAEIERDERNGVEISLEKSYFEEGKPRNGEEGWHSHRFRQHHGELVSITSLVGSLKVTKSFVNGVQNHEYHHEDKKLNPWSGKEEIWNGSFRVRDGKKTPTVEQYNTHNEAIPGRRGFMFTTIHFKKGLLFRMINDPRKIAGDSHPIQVNWKQFKDGTHMKIRETYASGKVIKFKRNDPKSK